MRRILTSLLFGAAVAACGSVRAEDLIWRNLGSDMSVAANYITSQGVIPTSAPTAQDVIWFTEPARVQPFLKANLTVKALYFGVYPSSAANKDAAIRREQDCSGYVISGNEGCTLTLTSSGNSPMAINAYTLGTNVVDVQLFLTGTTPQIGGSGHVLILQKPVALDGAQYSRDMIIASSTIDSTIQDPICVLAAENPNFKPKRLGFSFGTHFGIAHPRAVAGITEFCSTGWGGSDNPTLHNLCGETLVLDDVLTWSPGWQQGYDGLNQFTVAGAHPIIMTNCVFALSQRSRKSRVFDAALSVKSILAPNGDGATTSNPATGGVALSMGGVSMLELFGDYVEEGAAVSHILIYDGMFYPHKLFGAGGAIRADRKLMLQGGTNDLDNRDLLQYPTLGVDQDVTIPVKFLGGLSFGESDGNNQRAGGFSGMGGERKVTLTDPSTGTPLSLVRKVKTSYTDSGGNAKGYIAPFTWVFGNKSATGTAALQNDCTLANSSDSKSKTYEVWALQGKADVAGRFAGTVTIFPGTNTCKFRKMGDGVLAFEKAMVGLSQPSSVEAGGLLLNANFRISGIEWTVKTNAWIGGKGQCNTVTVDGGGAVAGGEFGAGEFRPMGVKLDSGAGINVYFRGGKAGCVTCTGTGAFTAGGNNFIRVDVEEDAPIQGKAKVLDWSGYTGSLATATMFDLDNYEIIYDKERITSLTVVEQDDAIWINYMCAAPGFKVMVR